MFQHLGYLAIWSFMLAIACIYRFILSNFISIFSWVLLVAFLIDLFFKYRSSPYVVSFLSEDHFDDLVHVAGRPQQGRDQQHQPLQKPVENISFVNLAYFFYRKFKFSLEDSKLLMNLFYNIFFREHVWYCVGDLGATKKHFSFYFTQTIFLTNKHSSFRTKNKVFNITQLDATRVEVRHSSHWEHTTH